MIWYFQEGFWPLVQVEIEKCGQELDSFKEIVNEAVNAKAKAAFGPRFYVCNTNQHCLRGSQPLADKANTHGRPMKDPQVKKPKPRSPEQKTLAPQHSNNAETFKQAWKKKKKKEKRERHNQKKGLKIPSRPPGLIQPTS